jgi:tRNA1Val (adenine37-N6)-methyltransferase
MFRFKQFTIHQQNSAMKVCTDTCLFGAIISGKIKQTALDIGTGTAVLSLMTAQRFPDWEIDGVEIDSGAFEDAQKNVAESPFKERVAVVKSSIQDFALNSEKQYDVIFSNPPFYQNQLKSPEKSKNTAHHSSELSFSDLAQSIHSLLSPLGIVWILLPPFEMNQFEKELSNLNLFPFKRFNIRHNEQKPVFRQVVVFARNRTEEIKETEILIYENDKYSSIFTEFLRDYYLIF